MFGIGMPEMLLILAVALIVIGPKKLPDLAKSLGRAFGEFKKATNDLKGSLEIDTDLSDVSKTFDEVADEITDSVDVSASQTESIDTDSAAQDEAEVSAAPPEDEDRIEAEAKTDVDVADKIKDSVDEPVSHIESTETDSAPQAGAEVPTTPTQEEEPMEAEAKTDVAEESEKNDRGG